MTHRQALQCFPDSSIATLTIKSTYLYYSRSCREPEVTVAFNCERTVYNDAQPSQTRLKQYIHSVVIINSLFIHANLILILCWMYPLWCDLGTGETGLHLVGWILIGVSSNFHTCTIMRYLVLRLKLTCLSTYCVRRKLTTYTGVAQLAAQGPHTDRDYL
jgi:hypothetical protein